MDCFGDKMNGSILYVINCQQQAAIEMTLKSLYKLLWITRSLLRLLSPC